MLDHVGARVEDPVLDLLEELRRAIGGHVADFHLEHLVARPPDELTRRVVRGDVVAVVVPHEHRDLLEAVGRLAEQRELCDPRCLAHRSTAGRTSLNRAPWCSASS